MAQNLPVETIHALYKCCVMDALAVENIGRVCRAWRSAADLALYKELIAGRWGPQAVTMDGVAWNAPQMALVDAWRKVYFHRALGKRLGRTSLENVDMSEVLGKRLATNSFWIHHRGWIVYSIGGRAMAAKMESDSLMSLGFTAKVLDVPKSSATGSFGLGRPGEYWETDGEQWLVVSRKQRKALAVFCTSDAGFSQAHTGLYEASIIFSEEGIWLARHVLTEPSPMTSLAVCGRSSQLASVCKVDHGKGAQVRVRRLRSGGGAPLTCRTSEEVLSVCWIHNGERLACGTASGEVLVFHVSSNALDLSLRLSNPTRTSRLEGMRFNPDLNLMALLEWRHGSREKGGDLRVWVCDARMSGGSWQRVLPPRARAVCGVGKEKVTNDARSCSNANSDAAVICDACWHEDSLVLLHRGGSASIHVRVLALDAEWKTACVIPQSAATSKSPTMVASLTSRDHGSGMRGRGIVFAGESAVLQLHTPLVW